MADNVEAEEKVNNPPPVDDARVAEVEPEEETPAVVEVKEEEKVHEDVPAGVADPKRPSFASTGTVIDLPPVANKNSTPRRPKLRKVDSKFFSSSSARDFAKEAAKIICPLQDEWSDPSKGTEQERKRFVSIVSQNILLPKNFPFLRTNS